MITINPTPTYSIEVNKLREKARLLGISEKEIHNCGNNAKCLQSKISAIETLTKDEFLSK
uniref:hypothetical protein n=1 Tax=Aliarcobacter sp. TaxID=2321116 RepID=UPI004048327D